MPADVRFLTLHGLRVKGLAEAPALASALGLAPDEVGRAAKELEREGAVRRRDGRVSGWSLTPPGRQAHERLAAEELEAASAREAVTAGYRQFLALNRAFLGLCSRWQTEPGDVDVDAELRATHAAVRPVVASLATVLDRFGTYGRRLDEAFERVAGGDLEWLTRPVVDSYHTVWFELHEDLLATLGIQRGSE